MINLILFGSFFVMLLLNIPIAVSLGMSSIFALLFSSSPLTVVPTNVYSGMAKFLLLAIPFFVLSGNIMAKAGISSRLVAFADDCVGHRRGGIAIVAVIVACFFGAISGSGPATVAALGIILIPAMINRGGFSAPFASSLMASASSIAIVIPPSIAFVVYASITGVSVGDMFMGGWIPGIMMGLSLVIIIMIECRKKGIQASKAKSSWGQRWKSFREAFWGFLMPVIIIGGIYGGVFTPTEAAAVSVVYGLVVGVFIYREVKMKDMIDILVDSGKTTGGIMLIIGAATLFSYVCTVFGIAQAAQALLLEISGNKYIFLLIVNVIFLIAGCFIDANSAMYIFIPVMLPVCKPIIAVLALWSFVGMWNSYFDAMIYLNDANLQPLQLVLRSILVQNTPQPGMIADIQSTAEMAKVAEQLKYATIVVSSLPLLVMYPFFQKYFDKGIMVGSVKG